MNIAAHTDEALNNFHAPEWGTLLEFARPRTNPANYIVVKHVREPLLAIEMTVEEWTVFKMLGPSQSCNDFCNVIQSRSVHQHTVDSVSDEVRHVNILLCNGKRFVVKARSSSTIAKLKYFIYRKCGMHVRMQRLTAAVAPDVQ